MAESPQHPRKIMENQTRFDLSAAVENWRQELAAQPPLTPDNRRELEMHLRDAIAGFQQRGLNDEESFWLARRRVGPPRKLGDEIANTDPARVWRQRAFWMLNAILFLNLWGQITDSLLLNYTNVYSRHFMPWQLKNILPDWILFYLPNWLGEFPNIPPIFFLNSLSNLVLVLGCIIFLSSLRLQNGTKLLGFIFRSRTQFFSFGLLSVSVVNFASALASMGHANVAQMFLARLLYSLPWTFSLIGLITWLLPTQNRKAPKRA